MLAASQPTILNLPAPLALATTGAEATLPVAMPTAGDDAEGDGEAPRAALPAPHAED